MTKDLAIVWNN